MIILPIKPLISVYSLYNINNLVFIHIELFSSKKISIIEGLKFSEQPLQPL